MNTNHNFFSIVQIEFVQERMVTGTLDMIHRCSEAGLPGPEFDDSSGFKITIWRAKPTEKIQVQPESLQSRVIVLLGDDPRSRSELSNKLGQKEVSGQLK